MLQVCIYSMSELNETHTWMIELYTCLIRHNREMCRIVQSEYSGRNTLGPSFFVGCHRMSENSDVTDYTIPLYITLEVTIPLLSRTILPQVAFFFYWAIYVIYLEGFNILKILDISNFVYLSYTSWSLIFFLLMPNISSKINVRENERDNEE